MRRWKDFTGMKHCPQKIKLETFRNEKMEKYHTYWMTISICPVFWVSFL
jgi:hypothetical protein